MMTALNISLCILAVHACTWDGMVLERPRAAVQTLLDKLVGVERSEWLQKPLFGCLTCMASVWGVFGCITFSVPLLDWPITILTVCGINTLFSTLLRYTHE